MKIRMRTCARGPGIVLDSGCVYDLPDEQAEPLVAGGYAEQLVAAPAVEKLAADAGADPPKRVRKPTKTE